MSTYSRSRAYLGLPLNYRKVFWILLNFVLFSSNQEFLDDFIQILKTGTNFDQYYFECVPVKKSTLKTQGFEFILKKANDLANRTPDYEVFEDELENCEGGSVSFEYGLR